MPGCPEKVSARQHFEQKNAGQRGSRSEGKDLSLVPHLSQAFAGSNQRCMALA